jgi:hypothetical protein
VVADHSEPAALFRRELFPGGFLLRQPGFEVCIDAFGEWDEFIVLVDGKADERNQVGQDTLGGCSLDL